MTLRVHSHDTIVAVATPPGRGGVAIVRLSGPLSLQVLNQVVPCAHERQPRYMYLGRAFDSRSQLIDQVLSVYMKAPHSYTGEDTAEVHCHGGQAVPQLIVDACVSAGARLADPGEFTFRAYMNGKLSLSQAEAVLKIIEADTAKSVQLAAADLGGALCTRVEGVRDALLDVAAELEAELDYGDEIEGMSPERLSDALTASLDDIDDILAGAGQADNLVEGINTIIVGVPNAGKSSLWNVLLGQEKALVTPYAGTTRDSLESKACFQGITLRLVDTAGLHETQDPVERMGIDRARRALRQAQIVVVVLDASANPVQQLRSLADEGLAELLHAVSHEALRLVVVLNKQDLLDAGQSDQVETLINDYLRASLSEDRKVYLVKTSLSKHEVQARVGVDELKEALVQAAREVSAQGTQVLSVNSRQRSALEMARKSLIAMRGSLEIGMPHDCLLLDLHEAIEALGSVTGDNVNEDILTRVFEKFCLGK